MRKCLAFVAALLFFQTTHAQQVSNADAHEAVTKLANLLTEQYPFPELSAQYKAALLKNDAAGKYNGLTQQALAEKITADLQKTHKDVHLHVFVDEKRYAQMTGGPREHGEGGGRRDSELDELRKGNYGFKNVDIDGVTSTAYINIPGPFYGTQESFEMAASAMNMAAYSRSVILDIRSNGGGTGQMGRFLASYFYEAGQEQYYLNGFYKDRSHDEQEWTYSYVPGKRLPNAKVYILVGRGTGSAAEGFAYAMQKLKRATIVGDTTAGAGIAGTFMALKSNLLVFLPFKMVVAPNSLVGWEGTGVIPDVTTGKEDALVATRRMILADIVKTYGSSPEGEAAQWQLEDSATHAIASSAKYAALIGKYNNNVSITADGDELKWNKAEPGKAVLTCVIREVKPNVLVIVDLNKNIGTFASRAYLEFDESGKLKGITRKTLMANGTIYTSPQMFVKE